MLQDNKVVYVYRGYDSKPFYVGMGTMARAYEVRKGSRTPEFYNKLIQEEQKAGKPIYPEIIDKYLSAKVAHELEGFIIDEIGLDNLVNIHPGIGYGKSRERYLEKRRLRRLASTRKIRQPRRLQPTDVKGIYKHCNTGVYYIRPDGVHKGKAYTMHSALHLLVS